MDWLVTILEIRSSTLINRLFDLATTKGLVRIIFYWIHESKINL